MRIEFVPKRKEMNCLIREQNKLSPKRQNKLSPKGRKFFPNRMKCFFRENEIISFGETSNNMSNLICLLFKCLLFPKITKLFSANKIPLRIN